MADGTSSMLELDAQCRAMREEAALVRRPTPAVIEVTGPEAAEYLQGQLTNDVEALGPGQGAYAALLDRKGHLQADTRVLARDDGSFVLVAEGAAGPSLLRHLSTYKVGREVEVGGRDGAALLSLIGPRAAELAGAEALREEHRHAEVSLGGGEAEAIRTDLGVDLLCDEGAAASLAGALLDAGAEEAAEEAAEILRVESGRPRFGRELSQAVMPAEAGIVERAVSFDKGCYIGQEPVARLHYRGRPNRMLRGLRPDRPAAAGEALRLGDREVGQIGTACVSPALGPIALAIVRREAEPGARVELSGGGEAEVVELPFAAGDGD